MNLSNKIQHRKFTDKFLLIVFGIIFVSFIALRIYQTIERKAALELAVVSQNIDQQTIADDLQTANQGAWQDIVLDLQEVPPLQESDHLLGQMKAPVQLIVYSDLTDRLAAGFLPIIQELKKQVGESVVIVWRQHPLADDSAAKEAAIAAECAGQQGKFWDFAEIVAATASKEQPLADWTAIAQDINLKLVDFEKCLTKTEVQATIAKQSAEAEALGAIGVPSSFLNKKLLSGVYPLADFTDSAGQTKLGLLKLVQQAVEQKTE
jgi:protein-disulfide isomerase